MLLVEDNPTDVFVIKEVLSAIGLDVLRIAQNGQEALAYLREIAHDEHAPHSWLILLDLNLPKVTGMEVLKELRANPRCKNIPVIVLTSSAAESDRRAAGNLGAEGYFQKPGDLTAYADLAQLVQRVLSERKNRGA